MNILMLTPEYEPAIRGGLGRHVTDVSRALGALGCTVHVITYGISADALEREQHENIIIHRVQTPLDLNNLDWDLRCANMNSLYLWKAIDVIRRYPIDILHAQDWGVTQAICGLKHLVSIPLITTIHLNVEHADPALEYYHHSQVRTLINLSEQVICCSKFMEHLLCETYGYVNKMRVIPNGVFLDNFPVVECLGQHVLFVGRLVPRKGADHAILAFNQIAQEIDGNLLIVGDGAPMYRQELQELVSSLYISTRVQFIGNVVHANLPGYFAQARIAVVPSVQEPFGIVALEAMASGIPVVVYDSGGLSEIVTNGVNGFKAQSGEPTNLAAVMQKIFVQANALATVRKQARQDVEMLYTWGRIATLTRDLYTDVLAHANP